MRLRFRSPFHIPSWLRDYWWFVLRGAALLLLCVVAIAAWIRSGATDFTYKGPLDSIESIDYEKVSGGQQAGLRIRAPSFDFSDNSGLYFDEDQPRVRPLVVNVTVSDEMALQMGRRIDENSDRGLHSEPDVCCNWVHCRDGRFVGGWATYPRYVGEYRLCAWYARER